MEINRKRIAILLNWRKGWMGGIIYIINLINSLNYLEDEYKPEILLLYKQDLKEFVKEIHYPFLTSIEWEFPNYRNAYILSWLTGVNYFVKGIIDRYKPDGIYPLNDWPVPNRYFEKNKVKVVSWFPDLQHKFYPHFFTKLRVFMRELRIKLILRNTLDLAVSSQDVKNHFAQFYQLKNSLSIHVLHFVSILPNEAFKSLTYLSGKYQIPSTYFILSNQFTNHKNHLLILEAIKELKKRSVPIHFVFTGKTDFAGNELYISRIRSTIKEFELEPHISILGVIPRIDQLSLMKWSRAVVQPSFFEGWSTVIEDAISLGVPVIASNLSVNLEQLGEKGFYFDPNNADELVAHLLTSIASPPAVNYESYNGRIMNFAKSFVGIFK